MELGTFAGLSTNLALRIDEHERVFGVSSSSRIDPLLRPWVWIDGVFHDLNDLLVSDEPIQLLSTGGLNRRGDLAATGTNARGERRAFLLVRIR